MKALRFGRKALELYAEGLSRYPHNFDLAYNKARLELEIATHPLLVHVLDVPVFGLLKQALASHEYALTLEPDNADALFNIAQVLTALAEQIAKDESLSDLDALRYLEQALEYQGRCLQVQEVKYTESRRMREEAANQSLEDNDDDEGGAQLDASTTTAFEDREQEEQWVSIIEPVTASTLLDTVLAQLATLTVLSSLLNSMLAAFPGSEAAISPAKVEAHFSKLVDEALSSLMSTNQPDVLSRFTEVALARVTFSGTLLELAFRTQSIDPQTYRTSLEDIFSDENLDTTNAADALIAHGKALISYNSAIVDHLGDNSSPDIQNQANMRWNTLSKAIKLLTSAANLPSTKSDSTSLATTHLLRGDSSLLLHALSYPPTSFTQAISNSAQLLKNAEVFYRNATKLFLSTGVEGQGDKDVAQFRGGIVQVLQGMVIGSANGGVLGVANPVAVEKVLKAASAEKNDSWRQEQLQDMVEEGLLRNEVFGQYEQHR